MDAEKRVCFSEMAVDQVFGLIDRFEPDLFTEIDLAFTIPFVHSFFCRPEGSE